MRTSYNLNSRACDTFIRRDGNSEGITDWGSTPSFARRDNTVPSGKKRLCPKCLVTYSSVPYKSIHTGICDK